MPSALLIDEPSPLRDELVRAIEGLGIKVHVTDQAADGLAWANQRHPDFVVLDTPLDGPASLAAVRSLCSHPRCRSLRVLLLCAKPRREQILEAARLGVSGIILKSPDAPRHILAKLNSRPPPTATAAPRPHAPQPAQPPAPPAPRPADPAIDAAPRPLAVPTLPAAPAPSRLPLDAALAELSATGRLTCKDKLLATIDEQSQLGALSPIIKQILSMTAGESASLDDISRTIKQDHSIAIRVLKMANSAAYSRGDHIDTIHKAVSRIGISQIRSVVLSINVVDSFGPALLCKRIRADWFWEHSIACALIASRLARAAGLPPAEADVMFTAGLLHDVGRMILTRAIPEVYQRVLETADRLAIPVERAEQQLLGLHHAAVTERIMRAWRFPSDLAGPIGLHHASLAEIRQAHAKIVRPAATLALADRLAHAMLLGSSGNEAVYAMNDLIEFLQIPDDALAEIEKTVPEQAIDMKLGLLSHAPPSAGDNCRAARTANLPKSLRVLFVSQGRPDPAHRHLADLLTTDPTAPPSLILASIDRRKDLDLLGVRITQLETESGVAPLPALVLSPSGQLDIPGNRRRSLAPASAAFTRLRDAAFALLQPPPAH